MNEKGFIIKDTVIYKAGVWVWGDMAISAAGEVMWYNGPAPASLEEGLTVVDGRGKKVLPGLVDMHVHFREPGLSYKETILTGSEAAAAGGFTTACTMPNVAPVPDSVETLQKQLDIIKKGAYCRVWPYGSITKQRLGKELVDYASLAPYVAGFSDDGTGVQDEEVMRKAMMGIAPTGKILAAHCEVEALLNRGYIHNGEYARRNGHRGICSESEWREIERDIEIAEQTGCRLHICHISTKESVELIRRAKSRGVSVTCETGPHYLTFCDEDLMDEGRYKMNPPLRSREDRDTLRQGLIDGTIDVIATDHAPHSEGEKSKGLEKSAMGVVGLETAFGAVYTTMVKSGLMPFEKLVEVMAVNPRKILGLDSAKLNDTGHAADFVLAELDTKWTVDPSGFKSMGRSTPYEGMELYGKPVMTVYNGKVTYSFPDENNKAK